MVQHQHPAATGQAVHALFFPDGTTAIIDFPDVNFYVQNRAPFVGANGKPARRPRLTVAQAKDFNITAIGFPTGAIYPIDIEELMKFFNNLWFTTSDGRITAKNAVFIPPVSNSGLCSTQVKIPGHINVQDVAKRLNAELIATDSGKKIEEQKETQPCRTPGNILIIEKPSSSQQIAGEHGTTTHTAGGVMVDTSGLITDCQAPGNEAQGRTETREITPAVIQKSQTDKEGNVADTNTNTADGKLPSTKPTGWAGLFGSNRLESKGLKIPVITDGVEKEGVYLKEEHFRKDVNYELRLIGYFTPRYPGPEALVKVVNSWKSTNCKFYHHASNWTIFTFTNSDDRKRVLENGPYSVNGQTLYVKSMPRFFEFDWKSHTTHPVWVQFPRLPLELWSIEAIGRLCMFIGTPHNTDASTKELERMSFTRVLVDVDVSLALPEEIVIFLPNNKKIYQKVFYEDMPKFCKDCKKMGHDTGLCAQYSYSEPKLYVKKPPVMQRRKEAKWKMNEDMRDGWKQQES